MKPADYPTARHCVRLLRDSAVESPKLKTIAWRHVCLLYSANPYLNSKIGNLSLGKWMSNEMYNKTVHVLCFTLTECERAT